MTGFSCAIQGTQARIVMLVGFVQLGSTIDKSRLVMSLGFVPGFYLASSL